MSRCWEGCDAVIVTVPAGTPELLGLPVRVLRPAGRTEEVERANVETPGGLVVPMQLSGTGLNWIIDLHHPRAFMASQNGVKRPVLLQQIVWPDCRLEPIGRRDASPVSTGGPPAAPRNTAK